MITKRNDISRILLVPSIVVIESPPEWGGCDSCFRCLHRPGVDDWFFEGLRRVVRYGMQTTFLDGTLKSTNFKV